LENKEKDKGPVWWWCWLWCKIL